MTDTNQKQLGKTLWNIADQLRGAMNADDFRDYMLSFLFLRYLSDNYESAAKKELGKDYPTLGADGRRVTMEEIEKNEFNLNISRYISTALADIKIDLLAVNAELVEMEKRVARAAETHNKFLKELGLPPV